MMAEPITAPIQDQIIAIVEEVARLKKECEELRAENKLLWQGMEAHSADIAADRRRLATIETKPDKPKTSAAIHKRKMEKVDAILIAHNNQPTTFADMGKLLGYPPETRKQNMTKMGNIFKQYPEYYEVKASKLGGKTIRLVPAYLNHLLNSEG